MSPEDFKSIVSTTRLTMTSREAARLVLCEGMNQVDAADRCGLSEVRISQVMKSFRAAQTKLEAEQSRRSSSELVAAYDASYAHAVKISRDRFGDEVAIGAPSMLSRNVGEVAARTDYHLVQYVGKEKVVVHDLGKLERAPAEGRNVAIEYKQGRGQVVDTSQERSRGGRSL